MKKKFLILLLIFTFVGFVTSYAQKATKNYFSFEQLNTNPLHIIQNLEVKNFKSSAKNSSAISQRGLSNIVDLKTNVNDRHSILQNGKNNHFQYINYYNSTPSFLDIQQYGNANSLHIYGKNSIIERLVVIQNTNFKSLVIKNY